MKKLFFTGALVLSFFASTTMQAKDVAVQVERNTVQVEKNVVQKENTAKSEGNMTEPECRYLAIGYLVGCGVQYGSEEFQTEYIRLRNMCLNA